ncbi:MAG: DUF2252 domain-containing protein [Cyanobium sp.]
MAASPFAFYRGSAVLFYADVSTQVDAFLNEKTSRVWIQGDLHAANFGTYMNSAGRLVFDGNDFDEAYVAPFTWDVKRLAASLALIAYQKAMSDEETQQVIAAAARGYVDQVARFHQGLDVDFALRLDNSRDVLLRILKEARRRTRVGMLDAMTEIVEGDRRFVISPPDRPLDAPTRQGLEAAFSTYRQTIHQGDQQPEITFKIKDMMQIGRAGIGSAGLLFYSVLLEGETQALENDLIIGMKVAQPAAPSRFVNDERIATYFEHDGHRTVVSQRALQAHADPMLGHTTFQGRGMFAAELSPYVADLNWDDINQLDEMVELVGDLGRVTAKIHCVSDADSDHTLVNFSIEDAIQQVLAGREEEFVEAIVSFGIDYGAVVREDHRLFVDAFRNHLFPGL